MYVEDKGKTDEPLPLPLAQTQQPLAPPPPKPKQVLQAKVLTIQGVPYIVVPVKEPSSGTVLSFDIYARGDLKRTKKLGTMVASPDGSYTDDILFY
jgi:hypothetical protein